MATTANPERVPTPHSAPPSLVALRRLRAAAAVRIGFGILWAIDASFKWLPAFVHGKTLNEELGKAATIHTPVIHQWIQLWHDAGTADPAAFAVGTALTESCIALGMIFGVLTNLVFIGSAVFSFGIWSAAEGFHLPWTRPGITDLGPSAAYIFASLALFTAFAGATWSIDTRLRPALGRLAWLASPTAAEVAARRSAGTARTT